jgi:hypothetical protein
MKTTMKEEHQDEVEHLKGKICDLGIIETCRYQTTPQSICGRCYSKCIEACSEKQKAIRIRVNWNPPAFQSERKLDFDEA